MRNKNIQILKDLKIQLDKYDNVLLLDFNKCSTNLLKKVRKNLNTKYKLYYRQIKTSLLSKSLNKEIKYPCYVITTNQQINGILKTLETTFETDYYMEGDLSQELVIIPKGVTKIRPSLFFKVLEKYAKVRLEKGYISFIEDYIVIKPNQIVDPITAQIFREFEIKPKKSRVKIKYFKSDIEIQEQDLEPVYNLNLKLDYINNRFLEIHKNTLIMSLDMILTNILNLVNKHNNVSTNQIKETEVKENNVDDFDEDIFI